MHRPSTASDLLWWQYAGAGGASGAATRALFQPLDVIKIRFQLQVEPIGTGSKYSSLHQAVRTIIKEEGITALWRGHMPAQYLSVTYGISQFWCYELLISSISKNNLNLSSSSLVNFTCGAVAGSFATFVSFPFDTVRTRIVSENNKSRIYKGVWHTLQHMCSTEGKLSLFKGLLPTISQIAPHTGAQFMFYKLFSGYLYDLKTRTDGGNKLSFIDSLSAGSLAGFLAKLLIYPFDLTKKRLQIQGFQHNRTTFGQQFYCTGFVDCVIKTLKYEGFLSLYKGLYPSLIKSMLVTAFHFAFFEYFCNIFRKIN